MFLNVNGLTLSECFESLFCVAGATVGSEAVVSINTVGEEA